MDDSHALDLASAWIAAWNAHDLDAVLAHFHDDVVFHSPLIQQLMGEPSGTVKGKAQLRAYWTEGLRAVPDLHFELLTVLTGVDLIVIHYRDQRGRATVEVGRLDGDRIIEGWGAYSVS
jgi:hypothetical protein